MNFKTLIAFGVCMLLWCVAIAFLFTAAHFIGWPKAIGIGVFLGACFFGWLWRETKIAVGE